MGSPKLITSTYQRLNNAPATSGTAALRPRDQRTQAKMNNRCNIGKNHTEAELDPNLIPSSSVSYEPWDSH